MKRRHNLLLLANVAICVILAGRHAAAQGKPKNIQRTFPSSGIQVVVFRAARSYAVRVTRTSKDVRVTGTPEGGAEGYHSPDPKWRPTPAEEWGMDFVSRRFGQVMVISTKNEIEYIHHHYALEKLKIEAPRGIAVVLSTRRLSGGGAPSLEIPTPFEVPNRRLLTGK